jgi:glyoxylase-like metal-dependent hydrolase (beta-lactamase superfamily II)
MLLTSTFWLKVSGLDDWFEIRELGDGIQLIAEPGHANSFLVSGRTTALLFDTGMGIAPIVDVVQELTDLPLLVVNSHDHLDHRGGNASLLDHPRLLDIAAHPAGEHAAVDAEFQEMYERAMRSVYADYTRYLELDAQNFFVASSLPRMRELPDLSGWHVPAVPPTRTLADGELIDLGGRVLRVLHTPGHAPDAICLYDESTGTLLAGDTILAAAFWLHGDDADLKAFAASTARLSELSPARVLVAHNLLSELPGQSTAAVAYAANAVLQGGSAPRPDKDLLGRPVDRHEVGGVVILTEPAA